MKFLIETASLQKTISLLGAFARVNNTDPSGRIYLEATTDNTVKFYETCGFMIETKSELKQFGKFVYRMGTMLKLLKKYVLTSCIPATEVV